VLHVSCNTCFFFALTDAPFVSNITEQETATICRERCGGQGYLSCNRFGTLIGFAHAGMTAEGDNRFVARSNAEQGTTCNMRDGFLILLRTFS
jgi:hypothetical protein